jgi:hypothetical protein
MTFDTTKAALNKYITYTTSVTTDTFEIAQPEIELSLADYYVYIDSENLKNKNYKADMVTLKTENLNPEPSYKITNVKDDDNKTIDVDYDITFTKEGSTAIKNTYPTEYGDYTVAVATKDNGSYKVTKSNTAVLHVWPSTMTVNVSIKNGNLEGTKKSGEGTVYTYSVPVTGITETNKVVSGTADTAAPDKVKSKLTTAGLTLPSTAEGAANQFTAPPNKKLGSPAWYKTTDDTYTLTDAEKIDTNAFDESKDLTPSLTSVTYVVANYVDDSFKVTFKDTKTSPEPEADVIYKVVANKTIGEDGQAVRIDKAENGDETETPTTTLPTPSAAPSGLTFDGWYTIADGENKDTLLTSSLTSKDLSDYVSAKKLTKLDPSSTKIEGEMTVYAVYVRSTSSTINTTGFEFKEAPSMTPAPNDIEFRDSSYATMSPAPTFDASVDKYYAVADKDADYVYIVMPFSDPYSSATFFKQVTIEPTDEEKKENPSATPTTTFVPVTDNVTTTTDEDTKNTTTKAYIPVDQADKGSTNVIVMTVTAPDGTTTDYTFNLLRYATARIELNYGNSPVGMIMSDDTKYPTQDDKDKAIAAFKTSRIFSDVTSNMNYYEVAWDSYTKYKVDEDTGNYVLDDGGNKIVASTYNGDDDPTAMFVFQQQNFRDVGFTAIDSLGNTVDDTKVSISATVKSVKSGMPTYSSSDNPSDLVLSASGNNHLFKDFVATNLVVRPDVYDMEYKFTDTTTGKEVTETRKLIVISRRGDVFMDGNATVNANDVSTLTSNISTLMNAANSLYKYKLTDVFIDSNTTVNANDVSTLTANLSTKLPEFYNALPEESLKGDREYTESTSEN